MRLSGDIDQKRFLQISSKIFAEKLKFSFLCLPNFPIVLDKPVGLYAAY